MHADDDAPDSCPDSDRSGLAEGSEPMKWSREELEHFVDGLIDEACADGVVIEGRIATKVLAIVRVRLEGAAATLDVASKAMREREPSTGNVTNDAFARYQFASLAALLDVVAEALRGT